jgi:hypothetical protein
METMMMVTMMMVTMMIVTRRTLAAGQSASFASTLLFRMIAAEKECAIHVLSKHSGVVFLF